MVNSILRRLSITLTVAVLCGFAPDVSAQDAAPDTTLQETLDEISESDVGEKAAKLVRRIRSDVDAAQRYRELLKTANAEDSLVVQLQLASLRERALDSVHQLGDVVVAREKSEPNEELRAQVEQLYEMLTPQVWQQVRRLRDEIDAVRGTRTAAPVDARLAIEQRVSELSTRLSRFYQLSAKHIEKMEALGLDTSMPRAELSRALSERADELSGRIDLALARIDDLDARLADSPDDAEVPVLLMATHKSLETNETSMARVLDLMEAYQLPTEVYRAQLVTSTRDITTGLIDRGVATRLVTGAWRSFVRWMGENGPPFAVKLLLFVAILVAFRFAARVVRKTAEKSLGATNLNISQLLRRMIITTLGNLVMFLGLLIALSQLGISLGPLLAGVGVAGFIVGFALQDSLANFAAGMMILIYRPYDVGDLVDVGGVFGKVDKMSVVSTCILTLDNQVIMVPNNKIWGDVIKNVTAQKTRRVDMTFGISYSDDIPKAEGVLQNILAKHDKVLKDPQPIVRLHALGESSVDFVVRPWVAAADYWDVYWDVTRSVKMRFDEEKISIPFPQRDVHVYEEKVAVDNGASPNADATS